MNKNLNEKEQEKVEQTFEVGVKNISNDDLKKILEDEATAKRKAKNLGEMFGDFKILWNLISDFYKGNYSSAPWKLIAAIVFAVLYLLSPLDVIPDFIPGGFIDDAGVFAIVLRAFQLDIDEYQTWKKNSENQQPCNVDSAES